MKLDGSRGRPVIDRSSERRLAMAAILVAIAYLCAAVLAALLPPEARAGTWLPLHLALAGAAATAIAGLMPFFSAAFAAAPPADARLRAGSIAAVTLGAAGVAAGVSGHVPSLAVAGGALFVAGMLLTALAAVRPLGRGLGPGRGLVIRGYLAAVANVVAGATLGILFLAGWPPVIEAWAGLRSAHAWLNLVGFVSLVIATTLLHFFPTVVGARIARSRTASLTVAGIAAGAPLVAGGHALGSDLMARLGAVVLLAGGAGLAAYALRTWVTRARWSSDQGWHRFAMGGLVSAIAWFELGVALAAGRVLAEGIGAGGTSLDVLVGPLVIGWVGLSVLASATHLVPAVGPGDPRAHARQRQLLGRAAEARLLAANLGIGALSLGERLGLELLVEAGFGLVALALGSTALLLLTAVTVVARARPIRPRPGAPDSA